MMFQRTPKGKSLFDVVACLPQGNNDTSNFTNDLCQAAVEVRRTEVNISLVNFSADSFSVETIDITASTPSSLEGKKVFFGWS